MSALVPATDAGQMQDDASSGPGGSRRPGNIWTIEAREDVFKRREAGEAWETICPDYPNRSRHAMQQQYSIMKKQLAIASGTWVTNRRGRKRKNASGETWTLKNGQQAMFDETEEDRYTEEEDFDDADPDFSFDVEDTGASDGGGSKSETSKVFLRPLPGRSATAPLLQSSTSRIDVYPSHPSPLGQRNVNYGKSKDAQQASLTSISSDASAYDNDLTTHASKRVKYSPEAGGNTDVMPLVSLASSILPTIGYIEDEILQVLTQARAKADSAENYVEEERALQKRVFEAAVSRANRRANDVQEKLKSANYEHADEMKLKEIWYTEELQARDRQHTKELQVMRGNLAAEQQKTYALDRIIEQLRLEQAQEVAKLHNELEKERGRPTEPEHDTIELQTTLAELRHQLATGETKLKATDQQVRDLHAAVQHVLSEAKTKYVEVSRTHEGLKRDLEDMSLKAIARAVDSMVNRDFETKEWFEHAMESLVHPEYAPNALMAENLQVARNALTHTDSSKDLATISNGDRATIPTTTTTGLGAHSAPEEVSNNYT
ncbi:hypothetical protein MMC19_001160 [Ptychographa xylographoides]|nr:hypothetical protein [Ptychographa xylographoides]